MGRPKLNIDSEAVLAAAEVGNTNTDIAHIMGCDESTIRKRFGEELERGRALQRDKLRKLQWRAAESGNAAMLIWLGKQMLSQTDKQEVQATETFSGRWRVASQRAQEILAAEGQGQEI